MPTNEQIAKALWQADGHMEASWETPELFLNATELRKRKDKYRKAASIVLQYL